MCGRDLIDKNKMKKLKLKNIKQRKLFKMQEQSSHIVKLITKNCSFNFQVRSNLKYLKDSPSKSFRSRITDRCIFSNHRTTISKHFKMGRSTFLRFARFNSIYGLTKLYW